MNVIRGFADRFKSKMTHLCPKSHIWIDVGDRPSIYQPLELAPVRLAAHLNVIGWFRCLFMWQNKMNHDLEGLIGENRKKHNYSRYWQGERERQIISAQVPAAPRELGSNTTNCFKSGKDSKRPAFRKTSVRKPVDWTSLHVQSR